MKNLSHLKFEILKTFQTTPNQFYPESLEGKVHFQTLYHYKCIERNGDGSSPFTITNLGQDLIKLESKTGSVLKIK